jgi:hypothetical protein
VEAITAGSTAAHLLVIDEVGYLSYSNRHADLLFELVSRRYEQKSTLVTTNRPFAEWREVFPNAACVVSLVDRLVHNAEILAIEGERPANDLSSAHATDAKPSHEQSLDLPAAHHLPQIYGRAIHFYCEPRWTAETTEPKRRKEPTAARAVAVPRHTVALYNAPLALAELRWREPLIRPAPTTSLARLASIGS